MARVYNRPSEKARRRKLRSEMPRAEVLLWSKLRGRQIHDCKFRRQYSVGPYIVDFYCPSMKLAIEVDGDTHFGDGAERRDARRQAYIESFGIRFLRFANDHVIGDLQVVVETIAETIDNLRAKQPPSFPPCQGGTQGSRSASQGGTQGGRSASQGGTQERSPRKAGSERRSGRRDR